MFYLKSERLCKHSEMIDCSGSCRVLSAAIPALRWYQEDGDELGPGPCLQLRGQDRPRNTQICVACAVIRIARAAVGVQRKELLSLPRSAPGRGREKGVHPSTSSCSGLQVRESCLLSSLDGGVRIKESFSEGPLDLDFEG